VPPRLLTGAESERLHGTCYEVQFVFLKFIVRINSEDRFLLRRRVGRVGITCYRGYGHLFMFGGFRLPMSDRRLAVSVDTFRSFA
jgi:hypothetical protein